MARWLITDRTVLLVRGRLQVIRRNVMLQRAGAYVRRAVVAACYVVPILLAAQADLDAQVIYGRVLTMWGTDEFGDPGYVVRASRSPGNFQAIRQHLCSQERESYRLDLDWVEKVRDEHEAALLVRNALLSTLVAEAVADSLGDYRLSLPEPASYVLWGQPSGADSLMGYWVFMTMEVGVLRVEQMLVQGERQNVLASVCRMKAVQAPPPSGDSSLQPNTCKASVVKGRGDRTGAGQGVPLAAWFVSPRRAF